MAFPDRLKGLREQKHLTQQQMADILEISKSAYIKYERGEREPRLAQIEKIADVLNVSLGYLLNGDCVEPRREVNLGNAALNDILFNPRFFERFGKDSQAIENITYSYLSHILALYYGNIDLLYMELMLVEKLEKIYDTGAMVLTADNSNLENYKLHSNSNLTFRKLMEEFLELLNDPDFYNKHDYLIERVRSYKLPLPWNE